MGAAESKIEGIENCEEIDTQTITKTPSQNIKRKEWDPRSPSSDIARTPTEALKTPQVLETPILNTIDDPRSPTMEFHRTPIIITNEEKPQPLALHNKLLDKARAPQLVPTPAKAKLAPRPIKLELQPENKRNSIVGLLETNLDFVETDLDVVLQDKLVGTPEKLPEVEEKHVLLEKTPEVTEEKLLDEVENKNVSVRLEDSIASVENLNKKLANLIYEDKIELDASPIKANIIQHRTPLVDHNPNLGKAIPTLRVNDQPTKLSKSGSKIPVFKDRKIKGKISNVQCENTPPRLNARPAHWATEDSMII